MEAQCTQGKGLKSLGASDSLHSGHSPEIAPQIRKQHTTVTGRALALANAMRNYRAASPLTCKQGLLVTCSQGREWALLGWEEWKA